MTAPGSSAPAQRPGRSTRSAAVAGVAAPERQAGYLAARSRRRAPRPQSPRDEPAEETRQGQGQGQPVQPPQQRPAHAGAAAAERHAAGAVRWQREQQHLQQQWQRQAWLEQQQREREQEWQQRAPQRRQRLRDQPQQQQQQQQQQQPPRAPAGPAYAVVPTAVAPTVAARAAAAAARAAERAGAAAASAAASPTGLAAPGVLPPARQVVPRQFWGLLSEQARPWHEQALVHLCYVLPAPACHIYREMRAGTMQATLAQRGVVEKALRAALAELEWQQQRLEALLDDALSSEGGFVSPAELDAAEAGLSDLQSAVGAARKRLHALQLKAAAYSDDDYAAYSAQFEPLLDTMQALAGAARREQLPLVLRVAEIRQAGARRALFARSAAAAAAAAAAADGEVRGALAGGQQRWQAAAARLRRLRATLRGVAWRYPPRGYVLWRQPKGSRGAATPPLELPGLRRELPRVRASVEQLPGRDSDGGPGL
ncbi:hypothetical protein HT031_005536 [Scenedesmus sp. PABB004]|nr:hypothetical protein HT031_005536 [Scenedesmus sp. PABB004]